MKRLLLAFACVLCLAPQAYAQIAFEDAVDGGHTTGTSLSSFNVDCGSGGNCAVNVCVAGGVIGSDADDVSVTIDGGAAALVGKTTATVNRFVYQFVRTGLTTGNKAVVVSAGSSHLLTAAAVSHTGVDSTGEPHATDDDAGTASSLTLTVTATPNSWLIGCAYKNYNANIGPAPGTGTTERVEDATFGVIAAYDSNGTVSGSSSMQVFYNDSMDLGNVTFIMGAFDDAGAGGSPKTCVRGSLLLLEVGC